MRRTTITISDGDDAFIKSHGLSASRLLRKKVCELRDHKEGEINFKFANQKLQQVIEKMQGQMQDMFAYLEKHGLLRDYEKRLNEFHNLNPNEKILIKT